ncbi:DUF2971 domain-containing protein [Sphingomonas sp. LM7]|uniref:DUF2971 domain-containing protein n=1 Tax=Sphingomonas sp. LM7 TaxID=1938607 RepID=UPI000983911C|nr:DUF2971 domain-containing protein [Sphingomonas sp. LM7]AQR74733.1 hypothetical protein BXU08_14695 [Sphingomonas sp. LM7]
MTETPSASKLPGWLSHYTDLPGLIGIVDEGVIRASNVAYLNDREELLHGVSCARKVLDRIVGNSRLSGWAGPIETVVAQIESGRMPDTYAACFCEKADLLSQWRGYGGGEQGVAIQFSRSGLEELAGTEERYLAPVEYGVVTAKSRINAELKTRLDKFSDDAPEGAVYRLLSGLIPRFKHIGFKGELEWRLVVQHETMHKDVKFRARRNVILPYFEIGGADGRLPIKAVKIGPGPDIELTRKSVKQYLERKGYDVRVDVCNVPFRT